MSPKVLSKLFVMLLVFTALSFTSSVRASGDPITPTPLPASNPSTIVLSNADFEAGLSGWQTWSEDTGKPTDAESLDYVVAPFFSIERNPLLIKSGAASLHVGRIYDPWHAGIKRVMIVAPNATVSFCIHGRLYASNRDFGHEPSWASLDGRMQVGVYPGDADWNTTGVVWSSPVNPHDEWREICVDATSGDNGRITLLASVNYRGQAAKHLDAWWDDATLSVSGGAVDSSPINQMFGITTTRPVSVLLLIPSQLITAYTVLPAQVFASAQGLTLAIGSANTLALLNGNAALAPTPIPASPTRVFTPTLTPQATPSITPTPHAPTVTATTVPTVRTIQPIRVTPSVTAVAAGPSPQPITPAPLIGLGALLVAGVVGAAYVIRRR
jgi:hypothetical protein